MNLVIVCRIPGLHTDLLNAESVFFTSKCPANLLACNFSNNKYLKPPLLGTISWAH